MTGVGGVRDGDDPTAIYGKEPGGHYWRCEKCGWIGVELVSQQSAEREFAEHVGRYHPVTAVDGVSPRDWSDLDNGFVIRDDALHGKLTAEPVGQVPDPRAEFEADVARALEETRQRIDAPAVDPRDAEIQRLQAEVAEGVERYRLLQDLVDAACAEAARYRLDRDRLQVENSELHDRVQAFEQLLNPDNEESVRIIDTVLMHPGRSRETVHRQILAALRGAAS